MANNLKASPNGKATTSRKTFSRTTVITEHIATNAEKIWDLLTNAQGFPTWNSTVISLNGEIRQGQKIKLKSTLDPSRTFSLKVKYYEKPKKLIWGDALGQRSYLLEEDGEGTLVTMHEKIGGPIFPLFASKIPSFDASFEQFMRDLKRTAEKTSDK
ncbi:MAG: SRPBCC family protein [Bacteroidota bacterium]